MIQLTYQDELFNSDTILYGNDAGVGYVETQIPATPVTLPAAQEVLPGKSLVSLNTIMLQGAPASAGLFVNFKIRVTKIDAVTGKELIQEADIIQYDATGLVTIAGTWDIANIPTTGDKIEIVPRYGDGRISTNPAIQTLDYVSSKRYGRGLNPVKDLYLPSWLDTARKCDQRSDIILKVTGLTVGTTYRYPATGALLWQGTVSKALPDSRTLFTNVIGKLTNKWNSWKSYPENTLVYNNNVLYRVTVSGVKTTAPTHTTGTVNGLEANPNATLSGGIAISGVEFISGFEKGKITSGYTLYDSDGVDYFRMLGWDQHDQRYVTRHQTNITIDTALPLFDNTNNMLSHFDGILTYTNGKYYLGIAEAEPRTPSNSSTQVNHISEHDIIGKIRLNDDGIKGSFNSLTASYLDPANRFNARNISFFNSDFLKADRNVPRKGNISVPGITNYYNTRILADKYLNKSRFGTNISFTLRQTGILLQAGNIIFIDYPRYGWISKRFRINTITHSNDCFSDIVAEEDDLSLYELSGVVKQAGTGLAGETATQTPISPPTDLKATSEDTGDESTSSVMLRWKNAENVNVSNVYTELYGSYSEHFIFDTVSVSNNEIITTYPHDLEVGNTVTVSDSRFGFEASIIYYVKEVIDEYKFTLSDSFDGEVKTIPNGTDIGPFIQPAVLLGTFPVPTNSFIDVEGAIDNRVAKYYWVRHKVI